MSLVDTQLKRVDEVEEVMSSGIQLRRVAPIIARKYNITRHQAHRYVRAVRDRWAQESAAERAEKREHIEATLWALYRKATTKKSSYVQRGKRPEDDRVVEQADPDIRGAANILQMLALMHGVIEPVKVDARSVHLHGNSDAETLLRVRRAYFGSAVDEPAALPETIDAIDE